MEIERDGRRRRIHGQIDPDLRLLDLECEIPRSFQARAGRWQRERDP